MLKSAQGQIVDPPIHGWFGLTYASYFVLPRLAMQEMPLDWQERFIALMDEANDLGLHCPAYHVLRDDEKFTAIERSDDEGVEVAFQALMHDATEAYCCDIPRPLKKHMIGYDEIEERLRLCICKKFGMSPKWHPIVHDADNRILFDERDQLMTEPPAKWDFEAEPLGVYIAQWSPESATVKFLSQFNELQRYRSHAEAVA